MVQVANPSIRQQVLVFDSSAEYWDYYRHEEEKLTHLKTTLDGLLKRTDGTLTEAKIVIFVCTKKVCHSIANDLWNDGVYADSIHGDKRQEQRLSVLENFRQGVIRVLVATDVAGRGLDFPDCTHVILFHFPADIDQYVHRVGRTARGDKGKGDALIYFDYSSQQPEMAEALLQALEQAGQTIPDALQLIVEEVKELGPPRGKWDEKNSNWNRRGDPKRWETEKCRGDDLPWDSNVQVLHE